MATAADLRYGVSVGVLIAIGGHGNCRQRASSACAGSLHNGSRRPTLGIRAGKLSFSKDIAPHGCRRDRRPKSSVAWTSVSVFDCELPLALRPRHHAYRRLGWYHDSDQALRMAGTNSAFGGGRGLAVAVRDGDRPRLNTPRVGTRLHGSSKHRRGRAGFELVLPITVGLSWQDCNDRLQAVPASSRAIVKNQGRQAY